jgi:AcrR family transcriptional regulator
MKSVRRARTPSTRVRERTRTLLLDGALRLFARKGVGATAIHEIAAEAGVANGTFYNYFRTREDILEAASVRLAERLQEEITAASADVADPAERVAIGSRRFVLQAIRDPIWAAALMRVWTSSAALPTRSAGPILGDLRAGRRRRRFDYRSEAAALDLLVGAVLAGMRTVLERRADAGHAAHVAALVLRGLGVPAGEADEIARRPLPESAPAA